RLDKASGEELGLQFDAVLYKPFKEFELLQTIMQFLPHNKASSEFKYNLTGSMLEGLEEELRNELIRDCLEESLRNLDQLKDSSDTTFLAEILHQLASRLGQIGYADVFEKLRRFEYKMWELSSENKSIPSADKVEFLNYRERLASELEKRLGELKSLSLKR